MKIGIYTDCHYSSAEVSCGRRYNNKSLAKIKEAYAAFEREGCALAVCLGDLIDTEVTVELEVENLKKIAEVIAASGLPTVCLMGNHDAFVLEREDFYNILGISDVDEMHIGGKRLIFLDACYFKDGRHYAPGDSDWTDCFLPGEEDLAKRLRDGDEDTYVFIHQNIDPAVRGDHRLYNADKIFGMICAQKSVREVFQGHYHPGLKSEYNGVKFNTLPAMCEIEGGFFIYEI